jgi:hypothetical protein
MNDRGAQAAAAEASSRRRKLVAALVLLMLLCTCLVAGGSGGWVVVLTIVVFAAVAVLVSGVRRGSLANRSADQRQIEALERDLMKDRGVQQMTVVRAGGLVVWGLILALFGAFSDAASEALAFWVGSAVSVLLGGAIIAWTLVQMVVGNREREERVRRIVQVRARLQAAHLAGAPLGEGGPELRSEIDAVIAADLAAFRKRLTGDLLMSVVFVVCGVGVAVLGFFMAGAVISGIAILSCAWIMRTAVVGPQQREERVRQFLQSPANQRPTARS